MIVIIIIIIVIIVIIIVLTCNTQHTSGGKQNQNSPISNYSYWSALGQVTKQAKPKAAS
jgi:hypothetical protein